MPRIATPIRRRFVARQLRVDAAENEFLERLPLHASNGDEERYANRIGNSTKGLAHDPITGEVLASAYDALLRALRSGEPNDFDALVTGGHMGATGPVQRRFVNPQSAYAYDLEGPDSHRLVMPPAPAFASAQEAAEMIELYWMALLRDVPFEKYATDPVAAAAAADLSNLTDFRGPKHGVTVTPHLLFRDEYPGCEAGPYVSQFLLQPVNLGAQSIDTRVATNAPGSDFLTTFSEWLSVIDGNQPAPSPLIGTSPPVYCYNGRALSQYVHVDLLFQAYLVACINLLTHGYPADSGNPYGRFVDGSGTGKPLPAGVSGPLAEVGFGTFGAPAIATLACEPATRALKCQWYQKWLVHRRLRPEEFGGRVEVQRLGRATYPFHDDLFASNVLGEIAAKFAGTHLLPIAFPEGSPLHTAYGSGHATVAGACVTMLKAFFDESAPIQNPVVPDPADPTKLIPYVAQPGERPLTVGGELNKLASNISQGRNIAGVHWRTDATEANRLGEAVAIGILLDSRDSTNEQFTGYTFTRFDGTTITV